MIVKKVKLNNKSRKGDYYYVRSETKGSRPKYYKARTGLKEKDYIFAYDNKIRLRSSGGRSKVQKQKSVKELFGNRQIEDILERGYAETTINNILKLTPYGKKTAYMKLLQPIVKDSELRQILSREENVQRFKHRLGFEIYLHGESNEVLATMEYPHKGKTLAQVASDLKGIKLGEEIADNYAHIANRMKNLGYTYSHKKNGTLRNISVKIIFRKG